MNKVRLEKGRYEFYLSKTQVLGGYGQNDKVIFDIALPAFYGSFPIGANEKIDELISKIECMKELVNLGATVTPHIEVDTSYLRVVVDKEDLEVEYYTTAPVIVTREKQSSHVEIDLTGIIGEDADIKITIGDRSIVT